MSKVVSHPAEDLSTAVPKESAAARLRETLPLLILAAGVAALFLSAPYRADMWWSDAPRHAMDGAFYRDFFRFLPFAHWKQWAMNYYLQYPALAIAFYPPLFPIIEAVFFQIFGVSLFTAQLTVSVFYLIAAWGAYVLSRRWLSRAGALAVSLIFIALPEVALWGRQVMLEVPACAFVVWSVFAFVRYLDQPEKPSRLYLSMLLLAGGIYTKQTALLIVPAYLFLLWSNRGWAILKDRHLWQGGALLTILVLPLAIVNFTLARLNVGSVVGGQWTEDPVFSWAGVTYYLRHFPSETTWPVALLALAGITLCIVRPQQWGSGERLFAAWLVAGYLFFSLIALKETRHSVLILLPLAFFAVRAILTTLPQKAGATLALVLASGTLAHTVLRAQVPEMGGYSQAVDYVARRAPRNSVVLFSGYRDGAFTFDMRARKDRRDLSVLRADKLLLRVAQRRELGVTELKMTAADTVDALNRYGVKYIVSQPNFWDDIKNMQMLQDLLHGPQFRLVATIPVTSNVNHEDHTLEIYENLGQVSTAGRQRIRLELPIIGATVEGTIGQTAGSDDNAAPHQIVP